MLIITKKTHIAAFITMARRSVRQDGQVQLSARGKQVQRLMELVWILSKELDSFSQSIEISTHEEQMHVDCVVRGVYEDDEEEEEDEEEEDD